MVIIITFVNFLSEYSKTITSSEQSCNVKCTTNESHFFVKVLTGHAGARTVRVSPIPGLKYGMEQ